MSLRFSRVNQEPLSKLALIVILFLDVFVLVNLFIGVSKQGNQVTTPEEYVPYTCRTLLLDETHDTSPWESRYRNLKSKILEQGYDHNPYSGKLGGSAYDVQIAHKKEIQHHLCQKLDEKVSALRANDLLAKKFRDIDVLTKKISDLERDIKNYEGSYDTLLLERIAEQEDQYSITQSKATQVKRDIQTTEQAIAQTEMQLRLLQSQIDNTPGIRDFWGFRSGNKSVLESDYKSIHFWYPVKRFGAKGIFLLPLFLIFFFWHNRNAHKTREGIALFLSSHLLVVTAIPIFWELLYLVLQLIPQTFLRNIFIILEAWNLGALWYYILIFGGILGAIFLVWIIQKKFFSKKRVYLKRLEKGQCYKCGRKLPPHCHFCPFCGVKLVENQRYVNAEYDVQTGHKNGQWDELTK